MRPVNLTDYPVIARAFADYRPPGVINPKLNLHKAMQYLAANRADSYIGHGYLLMVSSFSPWYSDDRVLQEELILSLGAGGHKLPRVIRFIQELAKQRGADYIMAGNSSQDPRLSCLYKRHDFQHYTDVFHKGT